MIKREDMETMAELLRKYAVAVETKLYWNMSTSEAKAEIKEAKRLASILEDEAVVCN